MKLGLEEQEEHTSLQKIIATVTKPVCTGRSRADPWEESRDGN